MSAEATRRVPLGAIALARSGDKGALANIGVWTRTDDAYAVVCREVTVERVAAHFAAVAPTHVSRFELTNLRACNFVLHGVLGAGGGSSSLRTDAQAKAYGQALLRLEIEVPSAVLAAAGFVTPAG